MNLKLINNYSTYEETPLSELFHENSKYYTYQKKALSQNITKFLKQSGILQKSLRAFKVYPHCQKISLPKKFPKTKTSLEEVICNRRSIRKFDKNKQITDQELSYILFHSYGITSCSNEEGQSIQKSFRASPSAGALYPLELYPIIFRVNDILPGLYHYNVERHCLENLKDGNLNQNIFENTFNQEMVLDSSIAIIISAVFERTICKYGERGYRFVWLDAGHLTQNLYLTATAMGLGCVSIGGFLDDELHRTIGLDGFKEAILYMVVIGKRKV